MENKITKKYPNKKIKYLGFFIAFFGVVFWLISPEEDLVKPYSTVVEDKNGELLSATIANDGQWRFPPSDSIPYKFRTAIRLFEDEYFNYYRKRHAFWKMYGLGLPDEVLQKLYYKNALRILPSIDSTLFP